MFEKKIMKIQVLSRPPWRILLKRASKTIRARQKLQLKLCISRCRKSLCEPVKFQENSATITAITGQRRTTPGIEGITTRVWAATTHRGDQHRSFYESRGFSPKIRRRISSSLSWDLSHQSRGRPRYFHGNKKLALRKVAETCLRLDSSSTSSASTSASNLRKRFPQR